jgi:putative acetyltransferase
VIIRDECNTDVGAIRRVIEAAFGRCAEADLVDRLRVDGDSILSLIAVKEGDLVGHVMFSKMSAPFPALSLAPVSVAPEFQRLGVGSRLIRAGLERAEHSGWKCIFVLGNPAYYTRFGFSASLAHGFSSPYAGTHFMARDLGSGIQILSGELEHAPAFQILG